MSHVQMSHARPAQNISSVPKAPPPLVTGVETRKFPHTLMTLIHELCHTHKWVMSHVWMDHSHTHHTHKASARRQGHHHRWSAVEEQWPGDSHTHINESVHTYARVTSHVWMSHTTHTSHLQSISSMPRPPPPPVGGVETRKFSGLISRCTIFRVCM